MDYPGYRNADRDNDIWQRLAQECAQGAVYNSHERQPHSKCLPGTRVMLLQKLKQLAESENRKIVWLAGESECGKSTVAHTLAEALDGENRLAGTFFFSKEHTRRSTFDYVLLTFAYQLGLQHHRARNVIVKAISDDPALIHPEKSHGDQLDKLIIRPLKELCLVWRDHPGKTMILDGIEEGTANGAHYIRLFMALIAAIVQDLSIPIHSIIITGRPLPQIDAVMRSDAFSNLITIVRAEDHGSREDIEVFFGNAFEHIHRTTDYVIPSSPSWPSPTDMSLLVQRSAGRFIFAAAIVRFIINSEQNKHHPDDSLQLVCNMLRGSMGNAYGNIHRFYEFIIQNIDPPTRAIGLKYLLMIVNLAESLSTNDLNILFGLDVYPCLLPFAALISLPPLNSLDPVGVCHPSLSAFLEDVVKHHGGDYSLVEASHIHRHLTSACFSTVRTLLKHDIDELQDASLRLDKTSDFSKRRNVIPPALQYACRHWLYHLGRTTPDDKIKGLLIDFLQKHVLFSIEVYAKFGELDTAINLLQSVGELINARGRSISRCNIAGTLLHDSQKLSQGFLPNLMMLKKKATLSDLESVDAELYRDLTYMLKNDITDIVDETFTTTEERFGEMVTVELKPGGEDVTVTEENKKEYVDAMVEYHTSKHVKGQFDAFMSGFMKKLMLSELESVDAELYGDLTWILKNNITDVLDQTFTTTEERFGEIVTVELKPGGEDVAVTEENKKEYVDAVVEHHIRNYQREVYQRSSRYGGNVTESQSPEDL